MAAPSEDEKQPVPPPATPAATPAEPSLEPPHAPDQDHGAGGDPLIEGP